MNSQPSFIKPDVDSLTDLRNIFADLLHAYSILYPRSLENGSTLSVPTLYIVIDALDELDKSEWTRFFELFDEMIEGERKQTSRLLITSRNEPEIEEKLAKAWNFDLGATDQNALDVAEYIKGTISDFGHLNNFGDESILEIILELTIKAEGMFLRATLAWSLFTDGVGMWTRTLVQRKLEGLRQIPFGIESLYHRVLSLVDKRIASELLVALKWIVAARAPLTIDEISVALSLRARPRNKRHLDIPLNMRAFFKRACPHLVKIDESGVIKLVHLSFRSFLLKAEVANDGSDLVPNPFHFTLKHVNYDIGLDCLSYITLEDFTNESLEEAQRHVFFSYSHKYWIHHLEFIEDGFDEVCVQFFKLLNFETKKLRWYDTGKMIFQLWDRGLAKLFEPATRFGMDLNVSDDNGDHFIHHVCNDPSGIVVVEETIRWLVDLGVDLNGKTHLGQSFLHKCIIVWHDALSSMELVSWSGTGVLSESLENVNSTPNERLETVLELAKGACKHLLSYPSIDLNAIDKFRFFPLSYTIYWGMSGAMEMLLACPYFRAEKGHSALHIAAKEGSFYTVERLLERGIDVHGLTPQGETVLHLAAANGHYRILKLLVANADPKLLNTKDQRIDPRNPYANGCSDSIGSNGWTPLHLAVTSGNDDLVLWLIHHPWINLHIKDKHGRQAIAFAAAFGSKTMLQGFLSRDPAQFAHKDLFGNGLLHMASSGSNRENFDFLLSLEVTPDLGPNKWGNTIVDLAPTLAIDEHLHELGFVHSEKRKANCLGVVQQQLRHVKTDLE